MIMTQSDKKTQYRVTDVFTRMGVAMEELLQAAPHMIESGKFEGNELHGKPRDRQKAA
ncbi:MULTISPECIES: hypothetical protein [Pectobacterium]|uniref:hypothetical protein n=1 Tax=Pectobacterium TaxID=122277 RepID=UPI00301AB04A